MAFQDFDQIQERRRAERQQKFRRRLLIAAVSSVALLAVIGAAVFAVTTVKKNEEDGRKAATNQGQKQVNRVEKIVQTVCNGTRYKDACQKTLNDAVGNDTSLAQPKYLLKSAISAVDDEIGKAINKTLTFNFESPEEKQAIEDCKTLVDTAKEELVASIDKVDANEVANFSRIAPDLNNWLSAVISYQTTCVDGFPDGKLKTDVEKTLNSSQILASNSLALVKQFTTYLSSLTKVSGATRHLLAAKSPSMDKDGLPTWISHDDRRILKAVDLSQLMPNVTVAQDGSGNFTTITEALKAMPATYTGRYIIYVKTGVYDETVTVEKKMVNVTMVGDGSQKTIVTGNKNFVAKVPTFQTASFVALGEGFMAQAMGFRNTAGPEGHQAVAIRVQSDRSIFLNCRFEGYQDTLYAQTHRQYYRSCVIAGTVDFIFGDAAAIFQNCQIFIRKGLSGQQNTVTAQGRTDPFETTGIVIHNCTITADDVLKPAKSEFKSYLGRPWKTYSRTVIMESTIEDVIDPAGWLKWQDSDFAINTLYYAEYNNEGASAATDSRVKWPGLKVINKEEALKFTVGPFLQGDWINATDAPVKYGLYSP